MSQQYPNNLRYDVNGLEAEIFHVDGTEAYNKHTFPKAGWYWWCGMPGQVPDSDPYGPFHSSVAASADMDRKLTRAA